VGVLGLALGLVAAVKLSTHGNKYTSVDINGFEMKGTTHTTCHNGDCTTTHSAACFPGQAEVHKQGKGIVKINSIEAGDMVLVESSSGKLVYEPVLSFLHAKRDGAESEFLTIQHVSGSIRVSADHMLFVASDSGRLDKAANRIVKGDELLVVSPGASEHAAPNRVLSVTREVTELGMYAPLTPSGKIVVDGTVASNYATANGLHFGHEASHAAFFLVRAYHKLGFSSLLASYWGQSKVSEADEVHPLAVFYVKTMLPVMS